MFVVKQDWIVGDVFVGCLNGFLECLKKFFEGGLWGNVKHSLNKALLKYPAWTSPPRSKNFGEKFLV